MKCNIDEMLLSRFIDNELDKENNELIEKHIGDCPKCKRLVDAFISFDDSLNVIKNVKDFKELDAEFEEKLENFILKKEKTPLPDFGEVVDRLSGGVSDIFEAFFRPKVPVLVKAVATITVVIFSLTTGLYLNGTESLYVSGLEGAGFVMKAGSTEWMELDAKMHLSKGDVIRSMAESEIDINLRSKYYMRLKPNTTIKVAKLPKRLGKGTSSFDLENGDLMVSINETYKGSTFGVVTNELEATALGTQFMMSADIMSSKTWVGVLEGSVNLTSREIPTMPVEEMKKIKVDAGMKAEAVLGEPISEPVPLLDEEVRQLTELYALGIKTKVALLIGSGEDRVYELLRPCSIYISDEKPRVIPQALERAMYLIYKAEEKDDKKLHLEGINELENIVISDKKAEYNVKILLFIGAYYRYIREYGKAIKTFDDIVKKYQGNLLLSLAECAKAIIYEYDLKNISKARDIYKNIVRSYPDSPEAELAKKKLRTSVN